MNKETILHNLEIVRQYLGVFTEEFSTMFGKEKSYYRKVIKNQNKIPDLEFIVKLCEFCHIKINRFLNEKLELKLEFESDNDLHSGETENKGDNNEK